MHIPIKENSGLPIYRQIVDRIYEDIKSGALPRASKLPTVRNLAEQMGVSRGTIKHAYDELEHLQMIEMTQGRGTFVANKAEHANESKKVRAMDAITRLLDEMEDLSFSTRETQIFFELKLREREERDTGVRIAVVECNPETLHLIENQLSAIHHIEVYRFLLEDVLKMPCKLENDIDLLITTASHFSALESVVPKEVKVVRTVLSPTQDTVVELAMLHDGQKIGIVSASGKYANIMREGCVTLSGGEHTIDMHLFGEKPVEMAGFLADKDVLVLPPDYARFASSKEITAIDRFQGCGGKIILYAYQIDGGSFMYLEEQIVEVQKNRRSRFV